MSRRRLSLVAYMRRRWRAVGAILVLLIGSLLVLTVTDRGHDPIWETRVGQEIDQAALSPDGSAAYVLVRSGENVTLLQALQGVGGGALWESPIDANRAVLAAGDEGVAVATDFPLAFLTVFDAAGAPRLKVPLEGNPVAMAMEGDRVALALTAPGNPVLVFEGGALVRTLRHTSPVRTIDLESGLLAAGGLQGEVVVWSEDTALVNVTLPMAVRSLRLSQDGSTLVAGGFGSNPADIGGHIALLDVGADEPVRWLRNTTEGVGLVDIDTYGLRALAVEMAPPEASISIYDSATGASRWSRRLPGSIARADSGAAGGAALAPDGSSVVAATLRGDLVAYGADEGGEQWTYRTGGAGVVTFADDEPHLVLAGARLLENRPFDTLLQFSLDQEPVGQRAPLLAAAVGAVGLATFALVVGVGYWRVRRPY